MRLDGESYWAHPLCSGVYRYSEDVPLGGLRALKEEEQKVAGADCKADDGDYDSVFGELKERNLVAVFIGNARSDDVCGCTNEGRIAPQACTKCQGPPERADARIVCDRWVLHELFDEWNHCRDVRDIVDQAGENP